MKQTTVVIGAGIVGLSTAYYLAKRGATVTVLDRFGPTGNTSTGNAGIIALGHPPLPRPGLTWRTIKWMFDRSSPLYVPLRFDPALVKWMWQFHRACRPAQFRRSMEILTTLGWEAQRCWDEIIDTEQIECEYHRTGWMDVFRTPEGRAHAMADAQMLREHGYTVNEIGGDELRREQPAFRNDVLGALHHTDSRHVSPGPFLQRFADRIASLGCRIISGVDVARISLDGKRFKSVETADGQRFEADTLVIAAGVWTTELSRMIGVSIPMQAGKGYHMFLTLPGAGAGAEPELSIGCVLNERFVAATPMIGGLRLAGTVELSGTNHRLVRRRLDMLQVAARDYLKGIDDAVIDSCWCGLRPCTADGLPVIGWAPEVRGVFIATGHAKYGLAYGPVTGKLASDAILNTHTTPVVEVVAEFSPQRFC